jgi:hypothetical protein
LEQKVSSQAKELAVRRKKIRDAAKKAAEIERLAAIANKASEAQKEQNRQRDQRRRDWERKWEVCRL